MGMQFSNLFSSGSGSSSNTEEPFSFSELNKAHASSKASLPDPVFVDASDGVKLAVRIFRPRNTETSSDKENEEESIALVFYHGGGAHSGAGYPTMAEGLAREYGISVYLPDLRGHGCSGGPRGDAPSQEQVWRDISTVLDFVARDQNKLDVDNKGEKLSNKIYLGGHSSGGGVVVNYVSWQDKNQSSVAISGYVLVAPQLGHNSCTARPKTSNRPDFAKVNIPAFIFNGIFGVLGNFAAVQFNYPADILEQDEGMVAFNTVNMANAITPVDPKAQIETSMGQDSLSTLQSPPIGLWVGSEDELFLPEKVAAYIPSSEKNVGIVVPGENHLGILVRVHEQIGPWITRRNE